MHRLVAGCVVGLVCALTATADAVRQTRPHTTLTASPRHVLPGHRLLLKGAHWGIAQFCDATVKLTVRAERHQRGIFIGRAPVSPVDAGFRFSWRVPAGRKPGPLTVIARQTCISGLDGHKFIVRRTATVSVG